MYDPYIKPMGRGTGSISLPTKKKLKYMNNSLIPTNKETKYIFDNIKFRKKRDWSLQGYNKESLHIHDYN